MRTFIFLLSLFVLSNSLSFGQDQFIVLTMDKSTEYYVSLKTITVGHSKKCNCDYIEAWIIVKAAPGETQAFISNQLKILDRNGINTDGYQSYNESNTLMQISCKSRRMRSLSIVDYDISGSVISSVRDDKEEESDWDYVTPDTIQEVLMEAVCKLKPKTK